MISLIVPVYNKAEFLKRCLASVAAQTDKSAQVIIVDDGSTDGSEKICDYYEKMVGFEVYHLEHGGVSKARNFGMSKAEGEYITFLDADDVLVSDALENMAKVAKEGHNIVQFGQYRCRKYESIDKAAYTAPARAYTLDFIPKYWVMVWNKLYKASFLKEHDAKFIEGMQFGEDTMFNAECILANRGIYHAEAITIVHCLDDQKSLCRGHLTRERIARLDRELCELRDKQTDEGKRQWVERAIGEHRASRLFHRYGLGTEQISPYDVVYFVKDTSTNDELKYSLRSVAKNWPHRYVWFCGGCPDGLVPDKMFRYEQEGLNKWEKVRNSIRKVCENDEISEEFWLFNDDFFVLRAHEPKPTPTYNGEILPYVERIEQKNGTADEYTIRLRQASDTLRRFGCTTFNYEVHKPMLINKKKALEVLDKFPDTPAFRSLYGNYWKIGGRDCHDMKIKVLKFSNMANVKNYWEYVSTSDTSFREGEVGEFLREKFANRTRFERG